jgi:hypothetical protein
MREKCLQLRGETIRIVGYCGEHMEIVRQNRPPTRKTPFPEDMASFRDKVPLVAGDEGHYSVPTFVPTPDQRPYQSVARAREQESPLLRRGFNTIANHCRRYQAGLPTTDKGEVGGSSPPKPTIVPQCLCGDLDSLRLYESLKKSICQKFAKSPGKGTRGRFLQARPLRASIRRVRTTGLVTNPHALRAQHREMLRANLVDLRIPARNLGLGDRR